MLLTKQCSKSDTDSLLVGAIISQRDGFMRRWWMCNIWTVL